MRAVALILAGGRGTRLGDVAKAALRLPDGRSFVEAVASAARAAGCARVVVVAALPHLAPTRAAATAAGCEVAVNPIPERGMASSIACGLDAIATGGADVALVWPVDHARVAPATAAAVLSKSTRDNIVVPIHGGRGGHPTAFGAALWDELADASLAEDGARAVVRRDPARVVRLAVDDPGVLADVDLPGDLDGRE